MMYDFHELLTRLDQLQILVIKVAEVAGVIIICVMGIRHQIRRFGEKA